MDLKIMQVLAEDGSLTCKEIAERMHVDKRTVAKRIEALKKSGALKITAEINWPSIGVNALAFVGTMTALGEEDVAKLYDYIRKEPRVIEAYSTLGSDEYFLTVVDTDLQTLREEVLRRLSRSRLTSRQRSSPPGSRQRVTPHFFRSFSPGMARRRPGTNTED